MDLSKFGVEVKVEEIKKPLEIIDSNLEINIDEIKENFSSEEIERFLPWFLKYQVKTFDDLIVTSEIKKILKFIDEFKNQKTKKGLLLYGQAGSGKTTTINLLAKKYDFELYELNASDARNKKSIDQTIGDIIKLRSLFSKEKLILIDEVDGASGTKDRGGVSELIKFIKKSKYPLCFTANDKESDKIKALKKVCITIDFENHSKELLVGIGKRIFEEEKINFKEEDLISFIEERNIVDIRGFINDLQSSVFKSKFEINNNLEMRNYKKKIDNLLNNIYKLNPIESYKSSFNTDIKLDDLFLYLEENTPNIYSKAALINSFNEISKADIFRGRIMKWQYWRYLVYVNFYLTFAVSNSIKSKENLEEISAKRNSRILKKWIYGNKVNALRGRTKVEKKKDIPLRFIENLAKYYGRSVKKTRSEDLFYFIIKYKNDNKFMKWANEEFNLDLATKKALVEI